MALGENVPIKLSVQYGDKLQEVEIRYDSYVTDLYKKVCEEFGLAPEDHRKYNFYLGDTKIFNSARLYDCVGVNNGSLLSLKER